MQLAALLLLPAAMLLEMSAQEATARMRAQNSSVALMLKLLIFGIILFGLGRVVEGYAGKSTKL